MFLFQFLDRKSLMVFLYLLKLNMDKRVADIRQFPEPDLQFQECMQILSPEELQK